MLLELFPILVAVDIWGSKIRDRQICFHCDNMGVVEIVSSLSASSLPLVHLLSHLILRCLSLNCFVQTVYVPGVLNSIANPCLVLSGRGSGGWHQRWNSGGFLVPSGCGDWRWSSRGAVTLLCECGYLGCIFISLG